MCGCPTKTWFVVTRDYFSSLSTKTTGHRGNPDTSQQTDKSGHVCATGTESVGVQPTPGQLRYAELHYLKYNPLYKCCVVLFPRSGKGCLSSGDCEHRHNTLNQADTHLPLKQQYHPEPLSRVFCRVEEAKGKNVWEHHCY